MEIKNGIKKIFSYIIVSIISILTYILGRKVLQNNRNRNDTTRVELGRTRELNQQSQSTITEGITTTEELGDSVKSSREILRTIRERENQKDNN